MHRGLICQKLNVLIIFLGKNNSLSNRTALFLTFFQYLLQNYEYPIPKTQGDSRKQERSTFYTVLGRFSQSKESTRTGRQERSLQTNHCRETGHRMGRD